MVADSPFEIDFRRSGRHSYRTKYLQAPFSLDFMYLYHHCVGDDVDVEVP